MYSGHVIPVNSNSSNTPGYKLGTRVRRSVDISCNQGVGAGVCIDSIIECVDECYCVCVCVCGCVPLCVCGGEGKESEQ